MDEDYKVKNVSPQYAARDSEVMPGEAETAASARTFLNRVYNWMSAGLALTGGVAYWVFRQMMANQPVRDLSGAVSGGSVFWSPGLMLALIVAELALVFWLSFGIRKMRPVTAGLCFLAYAALSGVTLAPVFLMYTKSAIYGAFFTCAGTFAVTSLFGYLTRMDLSGIGSFCAMGLIGILIASVVNLFLKSTGLDSIITYIGVFVFIGLTAWDTQKLKQLGGILGSGEFSGTPESRKYAIIGALQLYLDFINLFLMLLRIFGNRDNR